jgi:hypothetical protein
MIRPAQSHRFWFAVGVASLVVVALAVGMLGAQARPANAQSAVVASGINCSDFANQAAAQAYFDNHGGSTTNDVEGLDADHDGIACESLPCPCDQPGSSGGGGSPPSATQPGLGRSITLHRVTKHSGCRVRRSLPDAGCTPGAYYSNATRTRVCRSGYSGQVRDVSRGTKDAVYAAYGMTRHFNGATGEVDHLVSLELGGSNVRANLFPEAARPVPGSHEKDALENRLHAEMCSGQITLRTAQREIARNWVAVYRHDFGG